MANEREAPREEDKLLLDEELTPEPIQDAEVKMPLSLAGDLPENNARDPLAERPPREGVVRLPEATAEALGEQP